MSEKIKMLSGDFYTDDAELVAERNIARQLINLYNESTFIEIDLRTQILKKLFHRFGKNTYIEPPFTCEYGSQIEWGENSYASFNCLILDSAPVKIGDHVILGPNINIYTDIHSLQHTPEQEGLESLITYAKPVIIEKGVWIGRGSILTPGVKIGENSVIDACSVVTKDIPSNVVAAGNPCEVIKNINEES
ncbi:TPA: sugar O-acetyltransferase [Bacillus thuringiensis]|nr:sugar O-acetyltransferase [Bacillus thuringiensis]